MASCGAFCKLALFRRGTAIEDEAVCVGFAGRGWGDGGARRWRRCVLDAGRCSRDDPAHGLQVASEAFDRVATRQYEQGAHRQKPVHCVLRRQIDRGRRWTENLSKIGCPVPEVFMTPAHWTPIVLLIGSNLFMTVAWYGHLKFKESPLLLVILASWAIAFVEYCLAVPANRIGHAVYSAAELKTMQEVITLVMFAGFSVWVLGEPLTWKHAIGFALIALGTGVIFYK
jgi:uncharacterized protein